MKVLRIAAAPVVGLVAGVVVGALGSVAHWGHRPWGLVAALALVLASGTMMRAWAERAALAVLAVGIGAALVVLSRPGRGGDALIELSTSASHAGADPGVFGRIWVVGVAVAVVLVAAAPAVLFSDRPAAQQPRPEELRGESGDGPGGGVEGGLYAGPGGETDR